MILSAIILGAFLLLAVIYDANLKKKYNVKPRIAFASVSVAGRTEDSETMQMTATLFQDETAAECQAKLDRLFEMRETRLKFQNERLIKLQEEVQKSKDEAEKKLKDAGIDPPKLVLTKQS